MLATGGSDQTARLWDMTTHQQIGAPFNGDSNSVSSAVFSPDGQILATGSYDGTVRLWDVATQQQIGGPITDGSDASVDSVAFSPDGQTLAAGTYTGVLQLWDVSYLTHAVPDLCASVARFATPAELAQAAPGQIHQRICP
jgi:WD40 repeat protein